MDGGKINDHRSSLLTKVDDHQVALGFREKPNTSKLPFFPN
jgi:hypothetical protein